MAEQLAEKMQVEEQLTDTNSVDRDAGTEDSLEAQQATIIEYTFKIFT